MERKGQKQEEEGKQEQGVGGGGRRRERGEDKCSFYLSVIKTYYLFVFLSKYLYRIFTELCRSPWKSPAYHL